MLYVCVSFDYELFMGKNYVSEQEVLITPSYKIAEALNKEGVSATFFADVCCSIRYRELEMYEFPKKFDTQIQDLSTSGHDVQLHIHPHWLASTPNNGEFEFDRKYYRIHNWNGADRNCETIIKDGVDYLNRVIKPVRSDYRCIAFRAGGYCLQPEIELSDILYRNGIRIDSSVCQGFSYSGNGMLYDYKKEPNTINCYIGNGYGLSDNNTKNSNEGIFEIPVGGYSTFPYRAIASKKNGIISTSKPKGIGMKLTNTVQQKKITYIKRIHNILKSTNMLTFDFYNAEAMKYMLYRYAKENGKSKDAFITTIAHPKSMSDEHIDNMVSAIAKLKNCEYIKFVNMRDIADICRLV